MTAQIQDRLLFKKDDYVIVGVKIINTPLPTPQDYGISPIMINIACYRGYYVAYAIENNRLFLTNLCVRDQNDEYPFIQGFLGEWDEDNQLQRYSHLLLPINFSGRLLLGRDFIGSMFVHMGYQKPLSYRHVIELWVHKGEIIDLFDLSIKVAVRREQYLDSNQGNPAIGVGYRPLGNVDDIAAWVNHMFSLDYDI